MIVLIDNYDSFTFNLFHYLGGLGADVVVHRNDKISDRRRDRGRPGGDRALARALHAERGRHLPRPHRQGRRRPSRSSASASATRRSARPSAARSCARRRWCTASSPTIKHDGEGVFRGINGPFQATRYHSLVVERATMPAELSVVAETDDGLVMGARPRTPAGARRAVPSRKHRLRARASHPEEFSRHRGGLERRDRPRAARKAPAAAARRVEGRKRG